MGGGEPSDTGVGSAGRGISGSSGVSGWLRFTGGISGSPGVSGWLRFAGGISGSPGVSGWLRFTGGISGSHGSRESAGSTVHPESACRTVDQPIALFNAMIAALKSSLEMRN